MTDFFTDPRESANMPLWEHANRTPPMTGSSARKGTMRKPLSTFAWPWTCGRAFCKPLPACFVRFLLFLFFAKIYVLLILFFWGEAIARGLALYYAPVLSRAIYSTWRHLLVDPCQALVSRGFCYLAQGEEELDV